MRILAARLLLWALYVSGELLDEAFVDMIYSNSWQGWMIDVGGNRLLKLMM
jgi:hypothetical protein